MTIAPAYPPRTHAKIDGVRYGIDHSGRILAPDSDGNTDQLVLGSTVTRNDTLGSWDAVPHDNTGRPGSAQSCATRAEGIRYLETIASVRDAYPRGTVVRTVYAREGIDDRQFRVNDYGIKDGFPTLRGEGQWAYVRSVERVARRGAPTTKGS